MAINFAAANMAGYNNPNIEVFEAVTNEALEIVSAPKKSEIYNSLRRGCIPFILLNADLGNEVMHFLFQFSLSDKTDLGTRLSFTVTSSFGEQGDPQTSAIVYGFPDDALPSLI